MYIFYALCVVFLPVISKYITSFYKDKESSIILLISILGFFALFFSPLLTLKALNFHNLNILCWIFFALIVFLLSFFVFWKSYKLVKKEGFNVYKHKLKQLSLEIWMPLVLSFIFFLSILFVNLAFNDQIAYTDISARFQNDETGFVYNQPLSIFYSATSGYFVNAAFGFSQISGMYSLLWTIIPFVVLVYGCNDFLVEIIQKSNYKKYLVYGSIALVCLYVLSYGFIWAFGSGNTLLQCLVIFLSIYFMKKYNFAWVILTGTFLIYFSATGILLSIGLLIASFLYILIFKNIKTFQYWIGFLLFILGPVLSIKYDIDYFYILFESLGFVYIILFYVLNKFIHIAFLDLSFVSIFMKHNAYKADKEHKTWYHFIFLKENIYYLFIALSFFVSIMNFVLWFTYLKSPEVVNTLNICALIINLFVTFALGYNLIKFNKFDSTLFLIIFLLVAEVFASVITRHLFFDNQSIWRLSYLSIGYEVPMYWFAILIIGCYVPFVLKIQFKKLKIKQDKQIDVEATYDESAEIEPTKSVVLNKLKQATNAFYSSFKLSKYVLLISVTLVGGITFNTLSMSTYPISLSSNVQVNKTYFNEQEQNELLLLKKLFNQNTNFIADNPAMNFLGKGNDVTSFLTLSATNLKQTIDVMNTFCTSLYNEPLETWHLNMYNWQKSAYEVSVNWFNAKKTYANYTNDDALNSNEKTYFNNFINNTYYGNNYISNFLNIIKAADASKYHVNYLIFSSNSPYFLDYMHEGLFNDLQKQLHYQVVLSSDNQNNLQHFYINPNQAYLYVLSNI